MIVAAWIAFLFNAFDIFVVLRSIGYGRQPYSLSVTVVSELPQISALIISAWVIIDYLFAG